MAEDGKIRQRIELEGEKEYNSALAEARRNLKTLRSELKAETAELGNNATAQQKNEVRTKSLQKQIKEQEKVVKTYKAALDEVKEKYGDNEEAVAKWEQKLNEARATLANMRNSLDSVAEGMKDVENSAEAGVVAANSFADSLGKIADVGASISSAIESTFMTIVDHITEAIGEIWGELMDTAARANSWTDIATMWDSSAENIQKWYRAVNAEAKDFSRLSSFVTKIVTGDQKKIAEASQVSAEAYTDQWEYAMAVMDSLSKMDTKKQIKALEEMGIKGAKQEGWIDMLKAWSDIQENAQKFDAKNGGLGLTDEELEKANQLAINVAQLQTSWEALKDHALVNLFGDISLNITGNLQQIIEAFDEYFKAEDDAGRDAALQKIKDNIIEIFTNIKDAIREGVQLLDELAKELQSSNDTTAQTIGKILGDVVSALDWFTKEENWGTVVRGFEALIGVWAAGKIVSAGANLAAFAANILTIKNGGRWIFGGGAGLGAGLGTGAAVTVSEITSAITAAAGPIATAIAGITMNVGLVALAIPVVSALIDIIKGQWPEWMTNPTKTTGETLLPDADKETQEAVTEMVEQKPVTKKNALNTPLRETLKKIGVENGVTNAADNVGNFFEWIVDNWKRNGQNTVDYWFGENGIFSILRKAEEYADEQNAEEPQHVIVEPDENGYFPDWASIEDIMEYYERQNQLTEELLNNGGSGAIPADWWTGKNELTQEDLNNFNSVPGMMKAAVREGVGNIRVIMDGQSVGYLVAPYVSEQIARDMA